MVDILTRDIPAQTRAREPVRKLLRNAAFRRAYYDPDSPGHRAAVEQLVKAILGGEPINGIHRKGAH